MWRTSLKLVKTVAVDEETRTLALSPDGKLLVTAWAAADAKFRLGGLRLFEAAYYGHRAPSTEAFAAAWAEAEALERWVRGGAGP